MYVKPAPREVEGRALVVRDPDLKDLLPAEGRDVPDTPYWQRRLADGDVVLASAPAAAPAAGKPSRASVAQIPTTVDAAAGAADR